MVYKITDRCPVCGRELGPPDWLVGGMDGEALGCSRCLRLWPLEGGQPLPAEAWAWVRRDGTVVCGEGQARLAGVAATTEAWR